MATEVDIALRIIDGAMSVTKALADYLESMRPIKAVIQQARDEGRSLSETELDALRTEADALDAKLRHFLGKPPAGG
jgi:hypothetical protein